MLFQVHDTAQFVLFAAVVALVAGACARRLPNERRVMVLVGVGLVLAMASHYLARVLQGYGIPDAAEQVDSASILVEGMAVISLGATVFFRLLLPLIGAAPPRISRDVTVVTLHIVWLLMWFHSRGVNVAGLIATSAVLTAVVGLSMQDTLGNIVSGLALQLDDSLHVGDWIKIDDLMGQVVETRWRFTAVETHNWETVMIPNTVLMKNRFMVLGRKVGGPVQWRRWVWFNVDFRFPPTRVIEAVETALRAAHIPKVATQPLPNCVQMQFADSYIRYAVRYWLTDLHATDSTDSELLQHIYFALERAGISPSIPAAALFLTEETEERRSSKAQQAVHKKVEALRRIELFKMLSDEELEALASQTVAAPFVKGDVVTRQGAQAHWLYIMLDGSAEVLVDQEDRQGIKVATLEAPTCFGEWALMTGEPRDASVIAVSRRIECYRLGKEAFTQLLNRRPELAREFSRVLSQRRLEREAALENLDANARDERLTKTHSFVFQKICSIFGIEV